MNRLRCFLIAAIVALSSAPFALGGEIQFPGKSGIIQGPGKSDPPPPSPASTSATDSTIDGMTDPTSMEAIQIASQELATTMLRELLLTIF
jgi:hypothetical protein